MNKQYNKLINMDIIKQNIKDNQYPNSSMNTLADDKIRHFLSESSDYSTTYRILAATRIEIASLETIPLYGQGGKCA